MRQSTEMESTVEVGQSSRRRRIPVVVTIALVALATTFGGAWALASAFESPAQRAAAAKAPAVRPVLISVVSGALEQTISADSMVVRERQESTSISPSGSAESVVTGQGLQVGSEAVLAKPLIEVNGRPVLAIQGAFPFYRDLTRGDVGPDILQLQTSLRAAGYAVATDGTFGASTEAAVRAMYKAAGYSAPVQQSSQAPSNGGAISAPGDDSDGSTSAPLAAPFTVPRSELATLAVLPGFVTNVPAVGTVLDSKSTIGFEAGTIVANASVASSVAAELKVGMTGTVQGADGTPLSVSITSISSTENPVADESSTSGAAADQPSANTADSTVVQLSATGAALPDSWLHQPILAVITLAVAAKSALIVPSSSVVADSAGQAVVKQDNNGRFVKVPVKELATLDGKSAVSPLRRGILKAGDRVEVG